MKKIVIWLLIALFILSLLPACNLQPQPRFQIEYTLGLPDNTTQGEALANTSEIIEKRLWAVGIRNFDLQADPKEQTITIQIKAPESFRDQLEQLTELLTVKGELGFYETLKSADFQATLSANPQKAALQEKLQLADPEMIGTLGYAIPSDANTIIQWLSDSGLFPDYQFAWSQYTDQKGRLELYGLKKSGSTLQGAIVEEAKLVDDDLPGQEIISLQFTKEAAADWGTLTQQNIGNAVAVVFDQSVYMAPRVNAPILSGAAMITGTFSDQEAKTLAAVIEGGVLPSPLKVVGMN